MLLNTEHTYKSTENSPHRSVRSVFTEDERSGVNLVALTGRNYSAYRAYSVKLVSNIDRVRNDFAPPESSRDWTVESLTTALRGNARRRFGQLTSSQKAKVVQIANVLSPSSSSTAPTELSNLIASGKLLSRDSKGGNLLDTLSRLSSQELARGLDRRQILTELLERVNEPEKISQRNRGTCTVTSLEYMLDSEQPAEFARIVTGLVSEGRRVRLADGSRLRRDGGCLEEDDSGRAAIDRIFQASFMEHLNGRLNNYDNQEDQNERLGIRDLGSGLSDDRLNEGVDSTTGRDWAVHEYRDGGEGRRATLRRLQRAINDGHQPLVAMKWASDGSKHSYHQLVLTSVSSGRIGLWNPWGDGETGDERVGPPRTLDSRRGPGHISMTSDDFFSRLESYHLPPGY